MISTSTAMLLAASVLFYFTPCVLVIFGSTGIVSPEGPPLGTLHRRRYVSSPIDSLIIGTLPACCQGLAVVGKEG